MSTRWIKFDERGKSFRPRATLSANGYIALSHGACTRYEITDRFHAVVLYYDPDAREIGIEPVEDGSLAGARKLRYREMGADFSAKPFLERFNIRPKTTTRHDLLKDEETGFLVIRLDDGTERKTRSRETQESGGGNT